MTGFHFTCIHFILSYVYKACNPAFLNLSITWKCYGILGMQQNEKHESAKQVKAQAWTGE